MSTRGYRERKVELPPRISPRADMYMSFCLTSKSEVMLRRVRTCVNNSHIHTKTPENTGSRGKGAVENVVSEQTYGCGCAISPSKTAANPI